MKKRKRKKHFFILIRQHVVQQHESMAKNISRKSKNEKNFVRSIVSQLKGNIFDYIDDKTASAKLSLKANR
jgi:hypothetical protein